jgi:hypothetical protein
MMRWTGLSLGLLLSLQVLSASALERFEGPTCQPEELHYGMCFGETKPIFGLPRSR